MNAVAGTAPIWKRSHYLNRMTLRELVVAYFQYYTIRTYLAIAAVAFGIAVWSPPTLVQAAAIIVFVALAYPLVWYCLHRWVLHSKWMWKVPFLASTWKRIHYDHHQDPNHLEILFGSLKSELPPVFLMTLPAGYLIGGIGGAGVALAAGVLTTCFYEFCHCIQHLSYKPKAKWLQEMKARHMAHHFHDETGNYGIMSFVPDKLFGTMYDRPERPKRSPHVFNLGYTAEEAKRWPWVAELSGGVTPDGYTPRQPAASPVPVVPAE